MMRLTVPAFLVLFVLMLVAAAAFSAETIIVQKPVEKKAEEKNEPVIVLPRRADGGLVKAEALLSHGKYSQAISTLKNVLKRQLRSADADVYLGYAYAQLQDGNKSVEHLKHALKLNPRHLGAYQYLGEHYARSGKTSLALEQVQAMRLICGRTDCDEIRNLEYVVNTVKKGSK